MTTKFNVGDTVLIEGIIEAIYVETTDNEPVYHIRIKGAGIQELYRIRVDEDAMKTIDNAPTGQRDEWMRLALAKETISKFKGYLDEDMITRIHIALEKENEADIQKGSAE